QITECPNVDCLKSFAWLDLSQGAQVLCLPENISHNFILEILDAWTNVTLSIDKNSMNTFPVKNVDGHPIRYIIITGPDSKTEIPDGYHTIHLPTDMNIIINRVLLGPPRSDKNQAINAASKALYDFEVIPYELFARETAPLPSESTPENQNGHKKETSDEQSQKISQPIEKLTEEKMTSDEKSSESEMEKIRLDADNLDVHIYDDLVNANREFEQMLHHALQHIYRYSGSGWNYGKEAARRFDYRARHDFRLLARYFKNCFDSESWSEMPVERVKEMTSEEFFSKFTNLLKKNPPLTTDVKIVETLKKLGIIPGQDFNVKNGDSRIIHLMRWAVPYARNYLEQSLFQGINHQNGEHHWLLFNNNGNYGDHYLLRACVAREFPYACLSENILYLYTYKDSEGFFFNGNTKYVLHFDADKLPPVNIMWSLTMYDDEYFLVSNRLNRYDIRSNMPLIYNEDGSLDLFIQHDEPDASVANWLPAPEGGFMLMLRLYKPQEEALNKTWNAPAVKQDSEREKED
ncbi:MAG: DUF1254 domain-containing protein, partial [Thermoguttaceae bacterium]|nr:DUF1254 domain-containing protein [Thermoguttaceae bacterium]